MKSGRTNRYRIRCDYTKGHEGGNFSPNRLQYVQDFGTGYGLFIYDTVEEVNAKAAELILNDKHDFIAVYNGNYDSTMHKYGPESMEALAEARINTHAFATFVSLIKNNWKNHRTLYGFAMDHGCHEIDGNCGSHGLDMPEDLNIVHLYGSYIGNAE